MSVRFLALTPMLHVADIERTVGWYSSVLGFTCSSQDESWARMERDGVALMFMRNDHFEAPFATATQYIYVSDVKALWDAIKDRVTAEWGPEEMPYGMLEFAVRDPNGYLLSFGQNV